jgi:hypothetical protein
MQLALLGSSIETTKITTCAAFLKESRKNPPNASEAYKKSVKQR